MHLRRVDVGVLAASVHEGRVRQTVPKQQENGAELCERLHLLHLTKGSLFFALTSHNIVTRTDTHAVGTSELVLGRGTEEVEAAQLCAGKG